MRTNKAFDNPYLLMSILLVLWGSFAAASKLVMGYVDNYQLQFYMFAIAAIMMTVILFYSSRYKLLQQLAFREIATLCLYALPSYLYYFFYTMSLNMIPAVEASMLNYMFPVLIVLFAVPIHGERLNANKLISIALGVVGMVIIITDGDMSGLKLSNLRGDAMALAGAVAWAIFSNLGKKNKIDGFISNYIYVLTSLALSAISLFTLSSWTLPGTGVLSGLAWIAVSNIVISYWIWFRALKIASSSLIASLSFVTPFVTLLFIMMLLGEKLSAIQFAGLVIIIGGTAVQTFGARRDAAVESHKA